jgi:two-component system chemotaxis response regulator CheB
MEFELLVPETLRGHQELEGLSAKKITIKYFTVGFITNRDGEFKFRDKVRVFNVDDSPVILKLIKHSLEGKGFIEVCGQISDPLLATEMILKSNPDLVTLDIQMPNMNGVELLKAILSKKHFPIIMISSLNLEEGSLVMDALHKGAFDYIQKPDAEAKDQFAVELTDKILACVQSRKSPIKSKSMRAKSVGGAPALQMKDLNGKKILWCIGSSTGGTQALTEILPNLPKEIPPTLIVQHIPPVFSKALANSLNKMCPFKVKEAEDGEYLENNQVYIAPGGIHMGVEQDKEKLRIKLTHSEPVNRFRPSVDYLFQSVSQIKGFQIVACVLTGMGKDGAKGLLKLKTAGAKTFVQDEKSSVVFGMPRAAYEIGATDDLVALDQISSRIVELSQASPKVLKNSA